MAANRVNQEANAPLQAQQLMRALDQQSSSEDSDFDFGKILTTTRALFRPKNPSQKSAGRKKMNQVHRTTLLLRRRNVDFMPTKNEIDFLTEHGLGKKKAVFKRNSTPEEVEETLCELFPEVPLQLVGFKLSKIIKGKKLKPIENNGMEGILVENPRGIIVVIPKRDLPLLSPKPSPKSTETFTDSVSLSQNIVPEVDDISTPEKLQESQTRSSIEGDSLPEVLHIQETQTETQDVSFPAEVSSQVELHNNSFVAASNNLQLEAITNSIISHNQFTFNDGMYEILKMPNLPDLAPIHVVYIKRGECMRDMLNLYENEIILDKKLLVEFLGESGSDFGGLTKELFTLFWREIEQYYFVGEDCIVPFLPLHRLRKERHTFVIIGRILAHAMLLTATLPVKMSRCVYLSFGNKNPNDSTIVEDFLLHITQTERVLVQKGIDSFESLDSKEVEILTNFFTCYNYFDVPRGNYFKQQILEIATDVLMEKPKCLIEAMKQGFPKSHLSFWEKCDDNNLTLILAQERPTLQKILDCLVTDDLNNEQTKVFHYFQTLIQEMDGNSLLQLIFFITGSYLMPTEIKVSFNALSGELRRPISHTCSNTIELSSHYNSYQDFNRDMKLYLLSEYSYEYTNI